MHSHSHLEALKIYLAKSSFGYYAIIVVPVSFLIIDREVLIANTPARVRFNAFCNMACNHTREIRILGIVLKASAASDVPMYIHRRGKPDIYSKSLHLLTDDISEFFGKLTDDVEDIINSITKELMTSMVTVRATYTEDKMWNPSTAKSTSSGVVIRKGSVSYILTNRHGVTLLEGYKKIELEVEDCFGNVYSASVVKSGGVEASDASYDLAILAVSGMHESVTSITMATENPDVGERVFSIGSPAGQKNAITVGEITDFCNVKLDAETYLTNVEFGVFAHNAEVRRGSSGGALINSDLELVGINFAGKGGDDFSLGYAIPIEKVHEFIEKYM